MKYNPMFSLRSKDEMMKCYKNPAVIIAFVALILVVISTFIAVYKQGATPLSYDNLAVVSELADKTFAIRLVQFGTLAIIICAFVLSFIFKNSTKMSILMIALGCIICIAQVILFFYLTKTGKVVGGMHIYLGGWMTIVSGLLLIGNEFYKLGWQGYEVQDKTTTETKEAQNKENDATEIQEPSDTNNEVDEKTNEENN